MYVCMCTYLWKSEVNVLELVLSFHHVGPDSRIQFIKFSGSRLYPMNLESLGPCIDLFCMRACVCVYIGTHTQRCICGGQRTGRESQASPFMVWVSGMELRVS